MTGETDSRGLCVTINVPDIAQLSVEDLAAIAVDARRTMEQSQTKSSGTGRRRKTRPE